MNLFRYLLLNLALISTIFAADPPLNVGIEKFSPPFEVQQGNSDVYGFDIDMMNALCKIMKRTCVFKVLTYTDILGAVMANKVDVAVSSLTITAERTQKVNFSIPYLVSYSRFLTNKADKTNSTFSMDLLNNKTIGVEESTTYGQQLTEMGIDNPVIKEYKSMDLLVDALSKKQVNYILLNNQSALYWEANSGGAFNILGPPFQYGFGYGIAINKGNPQLLQTINNALLQYQNSDEFSMIYDKYFQL